MSFAIPDHPWVDSDDCAAVRIAMTACSRNNLVGRLETVISEISDKETGEVNIKTIRKIGLIQADLSIGANISGASTLLSNSRICGMGVMLGNRGFIVEEKSNIGAPQSMIKKIINGNDLMKKNRNLMVIDFYGMNMQQASQTAPEAYQYILERVKPERDLNNRKSRKENWWIFGEVMPKTRQSIEGLSKYIVTSETCEYRVFFMIDYPILPEHKLVVIGSDDTYLLGILSSLIHVKWAILAGGKRGTTPVYSKTKCFDPFPFPDPTPDQKQKIRELGDRLDSHRKQVQANHPEITITGMYNLLEKLRSGQEFTEADRAYNNKALVSTLKQIHDDLDQAVFAAYGWQDLWTAQQNGQPAAEINETILERLVALNAERAAEERNGLIRWLRPEYQNPQATQQIQTTTTTTVDDEETTIAPVEQQKWPPQPKAQLAAIRDLLRTNSGAWTMTQIASQFTGRNTQKKLDAISENLDRLEWFGLIIHRTESDITYWQYTEQQQTA